MSFIEATSLTKIFHKKNYTTNVLDGVDISVEKGEFVIIMGPSGSGKTTLLNLICGLDQPSSGSVIVDSVEIAKMKPNDLSTWRSENVGIIFQSYNLMPYMSAVNNVALPLVFKGISKKYRTLKAASLLRAVGLKSRYNIDSNLLSGGEQQRVTIARALINNPKIVVADEPTGDLDVTNATEIMEILLRLNKERKTTIIMSTHNLNYAKFADKVVYIENKKALTELRKV